MRDLNRRQLATILAALRMWQEHRHSHIGHDPVSRGQWLDSIEQIASDFGQVEPLFTEEIDDLCEALNTAAVL